MLHYKLRPWLIDDIHDLVSAGNNWNVAKYMNDTFPHPYTIERAKLFIETLSKENPIHVFAIEINGKAAGGIGVHPQQGIQRKNAELGYWLAEEYWGKGVMTKAVIDTIPFAFKTYPINRLFAKAFGNNPGSQKVLEKAGFVFEHRFEKTFFKNDELIDELIYSIRR